jgi:hypothetical protein
MLWTVKDTMAIWNNLILRRNQASVPSALQSTPYRHKIVPPNHEESAHSII